MWLSLMDFLKNDFPFLKISKITFSHHLVATHSVGHWVSNFGLNIGIVQSSHFFRQNIALVDLGIGK